MTDKTTARPTPWLLRLLGFPPKRRWSVRYSHLGVTDSGWEYAND